MLSSALRASGDTEVLRQVQLECTLLYADVKVLHSDIKVLKAKYDHKLAEAWSGMTASGKSFARNAIRAWLLHKQKPALLAMSTYKFLSSLLPRNLHAASAVFQFGAAAINGFDIRQLSDGVKEANRMLQHYEVQLNTLRKHKMEIMEAKKKQMQSEL